MNRARNEHIEECEKIFVSKDWFLTTIVSFVLLLFGSGFALVYNYAKNEQAQDSQLLIYKDKLDKIDKIEQEINNIQIDLDTLRMNMPRK